MIKKKLLFFIVVSLSISLFIPSFQITAAAEDDALLIINKAVNKLAFFDDGELVKEFPVATGRKPTYTPEGTFTVLNKIKNRPFYKKKIPGGAPNNPLGDRWLGLSVPGTWGNVYGIHGNNNESTVGKYISDGCVRMHNDDIRWLFDQIATGIPVVIANEKKDFETLAVDHGYKLKKPEIKVVNKKLTIFSDKSLYKNASKYGGKFSGTISSPQVVTAFEEADNGFYRIKTWFGEAWITKDDTFEGELKQVKTEVKLTAQTKLYKTPNGAYSGELSPQTVKVFEQLGNWYHIYTWFGDAWIKL